MMTSDVRKKGPGETDLHRRVTKIVHGIDVDALLKEGSDPINISIYLRIAHGMNNKIREKACPKPGYPLAHLPLPIYLRRQPIAWSNLCVGCVFICPLCRSHTLHLSSWGHAHPHPLTCIPHLMHKPRYCDHRMWLPLRWDGWWWWWWCDDDDDDVVFRYLCDDGDDMVMIWWEREQPVANPSFFSVRFPVCVYFRFSILYSTQREHKKEYTQ